MIPNVMRAAIIMGSYFTPSYEVTSKLVLVEIPPIAKCSAPLAIDELIHFSIFFILLLDHLVTCLHCNMLSAPLKFRD